MTIEELKKRAAEADEQAEAIISNRLQNAVNLIDEALPWLKNGQQGAAKGARRQLADLLEKRGVPCPRDPTEVPEAGVPVGEPS